MPAIDMPDLPFTEFGPGALAWFAALAADNSKAQFEATRAQWEGEIRHPLERLLAEVAVGLGGRAKLFRQHRDTRFSRDKSPYKTNTYGVVMDIPGRTPGLYVALSADGLEAGTGYWQMAPDQIARYRAAVDAQGAGLALALAGAEAAGLAVEGAVMSGTPRGVSRDHPHLGLLRRKDLLLMDRLPGAAALDGRAPVGFARGVWDRAGPVLDWLDRAVGPSDIPPEIRFGRGR